MTQGTHTPLEWQIWHSQGNTSYDSQCAGCNNFHETKPANMTNEIYPPWYMLFQSSSPDGRDDAHFLMRTTDVDTVRVFLKTEINDPHSTSYVIKVTDKSYEKVRSL